MAMSDSIRIRWKFQVVYCWRNVEAAIKLSEAEWDESTRRHLQRVYQITTTDRNKAVILILHGCFIFWSTGYGSVLVFQHRYESDNRSSMYIIWPDAKIVFFVFYNLLLWIHSLMDGVLFITINKELTDKNYIESKILTGN